MRFVQFFIQQILAVLVAVALLVAADRTWVRLFPQNPLPVRTVPTGASYYVDWSTPESRLIFRESLRTNELVVFGSSELTSPSEFVPFRFFPKYYARPTLAFGRAGAQCLTILTNLLQHEELLGPNSRVVIILSPWWFLNPGTDVNAFRLFSQPSALAQISANSEISPQFVQPLNDFMREKMHHINAPSLEMFLFRFPWLRHTAFEKFTFFVGHTVPEFVRAHGAYYQSRLHQEIVLEPQSLGSIPWNWSNELARVKKDYDQHSASNPYGFSDALWPNFKGTIPRELKAPKPTEMRDLHVLIEFLKAKKVPALFIQQPLNSLAYTHMENFDALRSEIAKAMADAGMEYVDYLTIPYEKEMLIDLAHFSDYGWLKADQAIQQWWERLQ